MEEQRSALDSMRAITISREYGSGGGEIATRLAQRLGWQLIDHEVVVRVARQLGISESEVAARDERGQGLAERILESMRHVDPSAISLAGSTPPILDNSDYVAAFESVVRGAAATGHVVIVGRGAQAILRERRDVLHVRVVAPLARRIAYVAEREGLDFTSAQQRILKKDRDRQQYVQGTYRVRADDLNLYDIVLNTNILDLDSCVALGILALERKATRLPMPAEALGPGVGLSRYPTQPEDFRVPKTGETAK